MAQAAKNHYSRRRIRFCTFVQNWGKLLADRSSNLTRISVAWFDSFETSTKRTSGVQIFDLSREETRNCSLEAGHRWREKERKWWCLEKAGLQFVLGYSWLGQSPRLPRVLPRKTRRCVPGNTEYVFVYLFIYLLENFQILLFCHFASNFTFNFVYIYSCVVVLFIFFFVYSLSKSWLFFVQSRPVKENLHLLLRQNFGKTKTVFVVSTNFGILYFRML